MKLFSFCAVLMIQLCIIPLYAQEKVPFDLAASQTMKRIYQFFGNSENQLLLEKYPFDENFKADYLNNSEQAAQQKKYAYLWPFSGSFSAVNALMELPKQKKEYQKILDKKVLIGLHVYRDEKRLPIGYASYLNTAAASDRFYDDNIWLGIDFTDSYLYTKKDVYLTKAKEIWTFVKSGEDSLLGGGIYWCEQKKESKNTCSNAPASVFALKLFEATKDSVYFLEGKRLYHWTKEKLEDPTDGLYWDNMGLNRHVDKAKYSYNSGQMLQAAALLYRLTKENQYLIDAQKLAEACYSYFFQDFSGPEFKLLKNSNLWFHAVMMRGFISLFEQDQNPKYITVFAKNLHYAWQNMRDEKGLFYADWTLKNRKEKKDLLDQCAFVEMYARLAKLNY
ncbi:glycoside hydrolase family 76 protein [Sphingobacterium faecium]|jgi:rhamnogalacturonyl hydrolase YesR|uniref:glycoside hydrolase family 76 protein n=1 Tax=Sphingobacterium faecium TaxID=34087 RepID=UPI0005F2DF37|nr:glycoside hydrolase family 76 protein [Sphingobacterium faecium]UXD69667.1 glycoside hydrolase family 76 protein [Sphingobacterium faecium]